MANQVANLNIDTPNGSGDAAAPASSQDDAAPANGDATTPAPTGEEGVSEAEISYMRKILRSKLVQSKNNVEIMRSDPNSPLYSIKTFEELNLCVSAALFCIR